MNPLMLLPQPILPVPNIWGNGRLLAFSGLDGPTTITEPFVLATQTGPPGLRVHWLARTLTFEKRSRLGDVRLAACDCADLDLHLPFLPLPPQSWGGPRGGGGDRGGAEGKARLRLAFLNKDVVLGRADAIINPVLDGHNPEGGPYLALAGRSDGAHLTFALAHSTQNAAEAEERARAGLEADFEATFASRLAFFEGLKLEGVRFPNTLAKALSVLKANIMTPQGAFSGRWATPDRWPHRGNWLWDSAFSALGCRHLDPLLAQDVLRAVLARQRANGHIAGAYEAKEPKPRAERTNPPILAWSAWHLHRHYPDLDFLAEVYPALRAYLAWNRDHRTVGRKSLLLGWLMWSPGYCYESGWDNSPRFDTGHPQASIDFNCYAVGELRALAEIARAQGHEWEAEEWHAKAEELAVRINDFLWDEETGFYYDREPNGTWVRVKTPAGLLPLFAGVANKAQAERLIEHLTNPLEFWTHMPVPTVALDEPAYEPDMWRGPVWVNFNHLVIEGLRRYGYDDVAEELRERTLVEVDRWYQTTGCLWEFYDAKGVIPPPELRRKWRKYRPPHPLASPIPDFASFTAACFVDFLWG